MLQECVAEFPRIIVGANMPIMCLDVPCVTCEQGPSSAAIPITDVLGSVSHLLLTAVFTISHSFLLFSDFKPLLETVPLHLVPFFRIYRKSQAAGPKHGSDHVCPLC